MKPYIITSPLYSHNSGGIRALHVLCKFLNIFGCKAYIAYDNGQIADNPMGCPVIDQITAHQLVYYEDAIVCYPENHLDIYDTKNIVRLILNAQTKVSYNNNEKLFYYSDLFLENIQNKKKKKLFIPTIDSNIFKDKGLERNIVSYYGGKQDVDYSLLPKGEILYEITRLVPETQEELSDILNHSKYLICFDMLSAISTEAALCGCPTYIVNSGKYTMDDYANSELKGYGICMDMEYIEKARESAKNVYKTLDSLIGNFIEKELPEFIKDTQC